jgi:EAL domain-containing protein (putative c-di-GMP-specific phosphodiesterase class I)
MENQDLVRTVFKEFRQHGLRIGIDDFGTGYSSLAYLHRLPLDLLKIDKSFVHNMVDCSESREIVRTIIGLANCLNLDTVAEGVETEDQHELLLSMGCSHAQGYFYSPPLTTEVLRLWLPQPNWRSDFRRDQGGRVRPATIQDDVQRLTAPAGRHP